MLPIEVAKVLTSRGVKNYVDIVKIEKFRIKISFPSAGEVQLIKKVNLEEINLKIFTPRIQNQAFGIVKGIPADWKEDEIRANLISQLEVTSVDRIKRRSKDKLVNTTSIRISFNGQELPRSVSIFGCHFRVEQYIFPVRQCTNCWGYGHPKKTCRRETKCKNCGKTHEPNNVCEEVKCINCGEAHNAADRVCVVGQKQRVISETMQKEKLTFREAKKRCMTENKFALLTDDEQEYPVISELNSQPQGRSQYKLLRSRRTQPSRPDNATANKHKTLPSQAELIEPRMPEENPYKVTLLEKTLHDLRMFWKNIALVQKLLRLHTSVNAEILAKDTTEITYEELLIRSTSLKENIGEFTGELALITSPRTSNV